MPRGRRGLAAVSGPCEGARGRFSRTVGPALRGEGAPPLGACRDNARGGLDRGAGVQPALCGLAIQTARRLGTSTCPTKIRKRPSSFGTSVPTAGGKRRATGQAGSSAARSSAARGGPGADRPIMYATHGCHKIGRRQPNRRGHQDSRQARPCTLAVASPFLATRATFARSIRVLLPPPVILLARTASRSSA